MTMLVLEPFLGGALLPSKLDMHEHDDTLMDEEADLETLSFSDLPLYSDQKGVEEEEWDDQEEDLSTDHSQGSSSISSASEQDYFEFSSQEFSPSFPPENIVFCGKLIPYKQSHASEKDRNHSSVQHQTKKQPNIEKKQGWCRMFTWNSSSTRSNSKNQVESRTGKKNGRDNCKYGEGYDFPVHKMSILTSSSSGKAAKWQLFLFGISRFSSQVELRDMKSRQSCRHRHHHQFSQPSRFQNHHEDDDKMSSSSSSRKRGSAGVWGLIKVLSCGGNHQYPNAMVVPSILRQ